MNRLFITCCLLLALCGCKSAHTAKSRQSVCALHTRKPIVIDGRLEESAWAKSQNYQLNYSLDKDNTVQENGIARFCWSDQYLYIGAELIDTDIVALGKEDQIDHTRLGDVFEIFLKPAHKPWYWELYATPGSHRTSYWLPGFGRYGLQDYWMPYPSSFKCAAVCQGTLNNYDDSDSKWTVEVAIPRSELTMRGESFGPGSDWTVLVSRYNYSRNLNIKGPELSMMPRLSKTDFHLVNEYTVLQMLEE